MHEKDIQFEQDLRRDLKHLGDRAPAGAGVEGVRSRLRRRVIRRTVMFTAGAAAAIVIIVPLLIPLQREMQLPMRPMVPQIIEAPAPPAPSGPRIAEAPLPEPIPAEAGPQQIQAAVFGYLSSIGVRGSVLICKEPGEPLYYAVSGEVRVRPEQLHEHLAAMLGCFETISIERRGRDVRCTLVAAGPAGNTRQSQQHKENV